MRFTRRAILSLTGLASLTGCKALRTDTADDLHQENKEDMTDRTSQHFNDDGELTSVVNNASISTGEVNNVTHIYPEDSVSDINSALMSPGTVVFDAGDHFLSDRIESSSADVSIVIRSGAHIKIKDDTTPTYLVDNDDQDRTPLFYITHDNVHIRNEGILNANNENHPRGHVAVFDTVDEGGMNSQGGQITDTHDSVFAFDSNNLRFTHLHYRQDQSKADRPALLVLEGCIGCTIVDVSAENTGETIDFNGINQDCQVFGVRGTNLSDQVLDINGSQGLQVHGVHNSGESYRIVTISGGDHTRLSQKSALDRPGELQIHGVYGTASERAILLSNVKDIKDVSITGIDVKSTGDHAVRARGYKDGMLNGLRLEGRAETTADGSRAWYLGEYKDGTGGQQVGGYFDIEGISADAEGIVIVDWNEVQGHLHAHDCGSKGILITEADFDTNYGSVDILCRNNGAAGFVLGGGSATGWNITGTSLGNETDDISLGRADSNRISALYGTMNDNGTQNTWV